MKERCMIFPLLLVLLITGLALGQTANNTSIVANNTSILNNTSLNNTSIALNNTIAALPANQTTALNESASNATALAAAAPAAAAAPLNATAANETAVPASTSAATVANLNYIWSFSGIEAGPTPITMVLEESEGSIFGRAKYEPDSGDAWNADVIGSVAGDKVDLTMSAQKNNVLTITRLSGIFANEAITGNFTQVSEGKIVNNGTFSAMWINPDTSSYTPAAVEAPAEAPAAVTPAPADTTSAAEPAVDASDESETEPKEEKKRFVDVREYRDKIGPGGDLSGVPPGMGGVGL